MKPLTIEEQNVFMPHLPMLLCRFKELNWAEDQISTFEGFKENVKKIIVSFSEEIVLPIPSITLCPYGREGRVTTFKSPIVFVGIHAGRWFGGNKKRTKWG